MNIPSSLIQSFITSEFDSKLTSTGEYIIHSPFCDDKKGKLYINKESGVWIDFKGGEQGSFLKLVKEYMGFSSFSETIKYLVENYDLKYKEKEIKIENPDNKKAILSFVNKERPKLFGDGNNLGIIGKQAYSYVLKRKLEKEYYPTMGYIYNPDSKFNRRVLVPFFENGKIVYFVARSIDKNNNLRYLCIENLDSKEFVFNIDKINEEFIIAEGVFDACSITTEQASTCLLSADIGVKQLEKIFMKRPKKLIYVPDSDKTGKLKMDRNIKKFITYCPYQGLEVYVYEVPKPFKDLNELKIATGKNYILKKECSRYGDNLFEKSIF